MALLDKVKTYTSQRYYFMLWQDVPKWKQQTHRLKKHNGHVKRIIRWLYDRLVKGGR
jgi:hypothetical protein